MHLSIYLSFYLSIYLCIYLSIYRRAKEGGPNPRSKNKCEKKWGKCCWPRPNLKPQTQGNRRRVASHLAQLEGEGQPPEPPSRTKKGSTQGSGTECPLLTMTTGKSCVQWITPRWCQITTSPNPLTAGFPCCNSQEWTLCPASLRGSLLRSGWWFWWLPFPLQLR